MKRTRETIQSELQEARARYNALSQEWDTHPDVVSEREARKLFEDGGFAYVEEVSAGAYHWGFVVRKKS